MLSSMSGVPRLSEDEEQLGGEPERVIVPLDPWGSSTAEDSWLVVYEVSINEVWEVDFDA
jgi:hypothetical protein